MEVGKFNGTGGGDEESADSVLLPLAGASQQPYISELLSFTLDRLHKEPELLRVDAERIRRQMQEVAVGNYRAFIAVSDGLSLIKDQLTGFDNHLESMTNEIPKLTSGCADFIELAQQILEERKLNETLLANHSTLLDLLEIPHLMDTCIRNGNYDEALDLEAFVHKLAKLHSEIPVIQALADEVKQTTQSLLSQLLQKLRSNIQLPECLRIVAHLRRLGAFSESEMRLQFLRCREAWLSGILDDLDQRNAYEYLKGMVNCHRMHLFDVVNQYRAIFSNDKAGNEESYDGGLLFSWSMHQIRNHLGTLEVMLPNINEGGSLSNIVDQCMKLLSSRIWYLWLSPKLLHAGRLRNVYCAISLGLVGLDFRGLLPPLFEDAVIDLFSNNINTAVENFQVVLDTHRWVPLPSVGFTANGTANESQDDVTPPSVLMEHPPLAVFVNGISAAMNDLRPCAPVSLKHLLAQELVKGLQAVSNSLFKYNAVRVLRGTESSLFLLLCQAFIEVAYPYCAACFGRCYPNGASLIMERKSLSDGVAQLLTVSPIRGFTKSSDIIAKNDEDEPLEESEAAATNGGDLLDNAAADDLSHTLGQSEPHIG